MTARGITAPSDVSKEMEDMTKLGTTVEAGLEHPVRRSVTCVIESP